MKDKSNRPIILIGIIASAIMIILMLIGFQPFLNKNNNYVKNYNNVSELVANTPFELDFPSFIYSEENLYIESVMGKIIEVRNDNFRLKASEFIDYNADVLGIYEDLMEDSKFSIDENNMGYSYFRYRNSGKQTILNWVKNTTSYGMVIDKVISLDESMNIIGVTDLNLTEYKELNNIDETDDSNYQLITEPNIKFKLPKDIEIIREDIANEAIYYFVDNKPVLVVAYNNPNKYLELYSDACENTLYNGVYFIYPALDKISEEDKGLVNYYKFLLTINEVLESIELINTN